MKAVEFLSYRTHLTSSFMPAYQENKVRLDSELEWETFRILIIPVLQKISLKIINVQIILYSSF